MHDDRESAERFARLCGDFERAWSRVGSPRGEAHYVFAGHPVRLRVAGAHLANNLRAAIGHLRQGPGAEPLLAIDLWDERESGVPAPPESVRLAAGRTWTMGDSSFATSPDGRFVSHQLERSVVWFDRRRGCMTGWFADGADLSLHQRGKPLQMLLALWASDRGLQAVHAAFVARGEAGVLVPGRSGSGKSTVALACLDAGFTYLGDDWAGVERGLDCTFRGHGLYASTSLEPSHAPRFPTVAAHLLPPRDGERKMLAHLADLYPQQLAASAAIRALALPRVVRGRGVRPRPASKRDALLHLAPSSVFAMRPRSSREAIERLAELAGTVPAYWLELGDDLADIPQRVDEVLADVQGRRRA